VGRDAFIPPNIILSNIVQVIEKYINNINNVYNHIAIDKYVIMPNHVHFIIKFEVPFNGGMWASRPTLNDIVCSFNSIATRLCNKSDNICGRSIFQSSYYDHIIRNEKSYKEIFTIKKRGSLLFYRAGANSTLL